MSFKLTLVDVNPKMIEVWKTTFEENPEVAIVQGSILDQRADAWVTPTNSRGVMKGGLDGIIRRFLGEQIERRVQAEINRLYMGTIPVGAAVCVASGCENPKFLVSSPTMSAGRQDISDTLNVALACGAAFQAIHEQNLRQPGSITTVAMPGLGSANGKTPLEICGDLMWTAYNLLRDRPLADFQALREALEGELGDLGPAKKKAIPQAHAPSPLAPKPAPTPAPPAPSPKQSDVDFDDV
jgi:O-acetyl-ADP-ribose deacetylase (regulator of RNase III)